MPSRLQPASSLDCFESACTRVLNYHFCRTFAQSLRIGESPLISWHYNLADLADPVPRALTILLGMSQTLQSTQDIQPCRAQSSLRCLSEKYHENDDFLNGHAGLLESCCTLN